MFLSFLCLTTTKPQSLPDRWTLKTFAARERIYKAGEPGAHAYVLISGTVQVTTVDEDQQEVVVDEPGKGDFFGFASMLEETAHQTSAVALEDCDCIEVSRSDIAVLH